jgi:polysaccharide export outer membrane protein
MLMKEREMLKRKWLDVIGMLVLGVFFCGWAVAADEIPASPSVATESYAIGAGDLLSISVWKNADLTRVVQVLPDGMISFPLVGEIKVAGISVAQLKKNLQDKLTPFVPDPEISVEVQRVNSMIVYVIGRINRPGHFELVGNMNVLQALAMAGGLTPFAKRDGIKVLRNENDKTVEYVFDYDAVTMDENHVQNIRLRRGDVVVVP